MKNWSFENQTIYLEDFLNTSLESNSVDLIVTSPPYNVDIAYSEYKDGNSYEDYMDFSKKWFKQAFRVLKKDGRMCLNIPLDKNKGGHRSVAADLTVIAKRIGFKYHSTIIWNEGNISRRTAWGSYMSASAPYIIAPVEVIVLLYKENWKKLTKGKSDISKTDFMSWTNGLWTFNGESKKRVGHPAPFPLELPKRCIQLFSYVGDTILDPFLGSGTTLIACHYYKRRGVGIEIDKGYFDLAVKRVSNECGQIKLGEKSKEDKSPAPKSAVMLKELGLWNG